MHVNNNNYVNVCGTHANVILKVKLNSIIIIIIIMHVPNRDCVTSTIG